MKNERLEIDLTLAVLELDALRQRHAAAVKALRGILAAFSSEHLNHVSRTDCGSKARAVLEAEKALP